MHRHALTMLTTLALALPTTAQVASTDEAPANGITVVVTGRAPCVPDILEVSTSVIGSAKTATGAQKEFQANWKRARQTLAKLPSAEILLDRPDISPPMTMFEEDELPFAVIARVAGEAEPDDAPFTARQPLVIRRTGLAKMAEHERLEALVAVLDVLKKADLKLDLGHLGSAEALGQFLFLNAVLAGGTSPLQAPAAPPPPVRFSPGSSAGEAAATRAALAEARRVATPLAALFGRKLGRPTTVTVLKSAPPPPASAKGGDHVLEMKVVFELL